MTNPTRPSRPAIALAAAAAATLALLSAGSTAHAQLQVGGDGHALDASTRAGSGGYNGSVPSRIQSSNNNQIVTGNVTGLNYFHGSAGTFDPNVLRVGNGDFTVQTFTRTSAPVNYAQRSTGQANYTPYYNQQQLTQPGAVTSDFTTTRNNVGIVAAPTVNPLIPSTDVRLQNLNASPQDFNSTYNLPTPADADGGPVNPVGNPTLYSMSPLYGVRPVQADAATASGLYNPYGSARGGANGSRLNAAGIQQLRSELAGGPAVPNRPGGSLAGQNAAAGTDVPGAVPNQLPFGQVPVNQPTETAVANRTVQATFGGQPVPSAVNPTVSSVRQELRVAPGLQSEQLAELQKRFAAAHPNPTAAQSAQQVAQMQLLLRQQKDALAKAEKKRADDRAAGNGLAGIDPTQLRAGGDTAPRATGNIGSPGGAAVPSTPRPDLAPIVRDNDAAGPSDQPFVISTLSKGLRSPTLAKMMRSAEEQMRAGQFNQAVDTYDAAAEAVPNNPFVPLGRSFAELGASYYGRAESDLTRAILSEPAVLAGQYDLKGFLGETRLAFVQKDLADIAAHENTARPHLLLAYLAHNAGQDDAKVVAPHLDAAADKGANPRLVELMRTAWNLKAPAAVTPNIK